MTLPLAPYQLTRGLPMVSGTDQGHYGWVVATFNIPGVNIRSSRSWQQREWSSDSPGPGCRWAGRGPGRGAGTGPASHSSRLSCPP